MSMRTLLQQVRSALTSYQPLTDLVSAEKITFARRPQRDELPGITMSLGNVVYDETKQSEVAAISYRVDVIIYGRSADETTEIHDAIKMAFLNASSSTFLIRLMDERYFVDADDIHSGYVSARWQIASGLTADSPTLLSPSWQGYDKMDVNYYFEVSNGGTTTVSLNEQVYYFDFASSSGSAQHSVQLPSSRDNLGKIYTFLQGSNVDNNTFIRVLPQTGETVETAQAYDLNRAHSSASFVAVKTSGTTYGWRIWAYHGLHD
jgi:hypothetical protein